MSNEIYYLISLGIVGILGSMTKIKPVILVLLYYPITKFILTYFQPSITEVNMKELDYVYMFFPNIFNEISKVILSIKDWIIKGPQDFFEWIIKSVKDAVTFIKDAILFFIAEVPKYIIYIVSKLLNTFIIEPFGWIKSYFEKIISWFTSGDALKYTIEWYVWINQIYYFQWQELINFFINLFDKILPIGILEDFPKLDVIKLDQKYFVLDKIQNIIDSTQK